MSTNGRRSSELISREKSRVLVVDVQERMLAVIPTAAAVQARIRLLLQTANLLNIPVSVTEQYPQGLGPTVAAIQELLPIDLVKPAKLRFSAADCCEWMHQPTDERFHIVVIGLETHVCILQSVMDLLAEGFTVYVPADAVGSRRDLDHQVALERLRLSGAVICTAESVVFEWCETAGTSEFKTVSGWVKNVP